MVLAGRCLLISNLSAGLIEAEAPADRGLPEECSSGAKQWTAEGEKVEEDYNYEHTLKALVVRSVSSSRATEAHLPAGCEEPAQALAAGDEQNGTDSYRHVGRY